MQFFSGIFLWQDTIGMDATGDSFDTLYIVSAEENLLVRQNT